MLLRISILLSLFLSACGQNVRDLRLNEVDLAQKTVVEQIGHELSDDDRLAFTTYVLVHGPSGRLCSDMRNRNTKQPETIGEAIDFMRFGAAGRPS